MNTADFLKAKAVLGLTTIADVNAAVAALVDSSPATLDTLNELAAALGDDPNFATTTATALGLKAPIADPTFTTKITTPAVVVTGSTPPANGLYLSAANTLAWSTNSGVKMTLSATGALSLPSADASINGITVGKGAASVATNTVLGSGSLASMSSGGTCTAGGYQNQINNVSGNDNTSWGSSALRVITGSSNCAFGSSSSLALVTGARNASFGLLSLGTNTGGSDNAAYGNGTLRYYSGSSNSAFGSFAMNGNSGGSSGTQNAAFGYQAMKAFTTASNCAMFGYNSGYQITSGHRNSLFGDGTGASLTTQTDNAFYGYNAGNVSTGTNNAFFGSGAGSLMTSGSNNIIIGGYTGSGIATASNNIVVSDGVGNARFTVDSAGVTTFNGIVRTVSSSGIQMWDSGGNAAARGWAWALNDGAWGNLNLYLGATQGGDPTAGTVQMSFTGSLCTIRPDLTVGAAVAATNVTLGIDAVANKAARIAFKESGTILWQLGKGAASENDAFELYNQAGDTAISVAKSSNKVSLVGDLAITTAGKGLQVKQGSNAKFGSGTLVGGTLVVSTTAALTASAVFLTVSTPGGTQGHLSYSISNATSFTVTSTSGSDTSTFNWLIVDPA